MGFLWFRTDPSAGSRSVFVGFYWKKAKKMMNLVGKPVIKRRVIPDDFSQDSVRFPFSSTFGFGSFGGTLFCFPQYAKKESTQDRCRS
jgi:hypothetical protein